MSRPSLLGYLTSYRGRFVWLSLATIAGTLIGLSIPYVMRLAIDAITAGTTGAVLAIFGLETVLLTAVAGALRFVRSYAFSYISRLVEYRMRNDLLAHLQRQPAAFFQMTRTGDLMARLTNDLN